MTSIVIHATDLLDALGGERRCPDCVGDLGVVIEGTEWDIVQLHVHPCVAVPARVVSTVQLPDVDSHKRCRRCGGLLQHDIGGDEFGNVESVQSCPRCDPRPGTYGGGVL